MQQVLCKLQNEKDIVICQSDKDGKQLIVDKEEFNEICVEDAKKCSTQVHLGDKYKDVNDLLETINKKLDEYGKGLFRF